MSSALSPSDKITVQQFSRISLILLFILCGLNFFEGNDVNLVIIFNCSMFSICVMTILQVSQIVLCQEIPEKSERIPAEPPSECEFSSFLCKPSGLAVVKTLMNISSVSECQKTCQRSKNCNFVTFTNFRNIATCHLLSSCQDKVRSLFQLRRIHSFIHYLTYSGATVFLTRTLFLGPQVLF